MTPEHLERIDRYLNMARDHLKDATRPPPDAKDLLGVFGRFKEVTLGIDPSTRGQMIYWSLESGHTQPRRTPPLAFAVLRVLLAFGGSISVNHNGKGLSYVRLFGPININLERILCDAKAGQVVEHDPSKDFRNNDPDCFKVRPLTPGKPSRLPEAGREEAVALAFKYFRLNQPASGIAITEDQYLAALRLAFRLLDASRNVEA